MAYALVGTIGVATQGTSGAAVTPAWGASESRTAGNLLICFVSVTGAATVPATPSGWSTVAGSTGTTCSATIFYKIAAGADAAPTIAAVTSGLIAAQLAEFSGNSSTPFDIRGAGSGTASPVTATLVSADTASGELLLMTSGDIRSVSRATNDTWTSNHGTITQAGSNNGTSSTNHYSFGYCLATTSNSGADTVTMTASITTSVTGVIVVAATFKIGAQSLTRTCTDAPTTSEVISKGVTKARTATDSLIGTDAGGGGNVPTSGLVSYWKLDETSGTRFDSYGTNHLTDNNTVGSTTGKQGNAASFVAASSEYLSCASNSSLQMSGNTDFTIACWVNIGGSISNEYEIVTKDDSAANSRDYTLDYEGVGGVTGLRFYIKGGGTYLAIEGDDNSHGGWTFVVAWYDSSNGQCHLRLNDLVTTNSATGATGTDVSNAQFRIGARQYSGFEGYLDGAVDEVGIWKRVLTSTEITTLYNGGAGTTIGGGGGAVAVVKTPLLRTATESIQTAESLLETQILLRTLPDAPVTSESIADILTLFRTRTDAPTISESITAVVVHAPLFRTATDAPTTSEVCTRIQVLLRTATDAPTTSELIKLKQSPSRATDALSTSEVATIVKVAGGVSLSRTASESLTTAEVASRTATNQRSATDGLTISMSVAGSAAASALGHMIVLDSGVWSTPAGNDLPFYVYVTAPHVTRTLTALRTTAEAPTTSESATGIRLGLIVNRTASELLSTSENATRSAILLRSTNESPTLSETASKAKVTARSTTDAPVTAESIDWVGAVLRSSTDALSTSEAASRANVTARSSTDALSTSESATAVRGAISVNRTASESLSTTESATAVRGAVSISRTASESLTTSDTVSRTLSAQRTASDAPATSESATRIRAPLFRTTSEALSTSESVARIAILFRAITEALATSELAIGTKFSLISRTAIESLSTREGGAPAYSRPLTVDHTKVPSTQTNFPVLVSITDAALKTVANGGHVLRSDGFDIGFYADAGGMTKLKWEIVSYDGSAGALLANVKIPNLSGSADTVFYLLYGNPVVTTDQSDPAGVWTNGYAGVWHLGGDGVTVNTGDSLGHFPGTIGAPVGPIASPFGWGAFFQSPSYMEFGDIGAHDPPLSIEAWVAPYNNVYASLLNAWNGHYMSHDPTGLVHSATTVANTFASYASATQASAGAMVWQHMTSVWASASSRQVFINGVGGTIETTTVIPGATPNGFWLGSDYSHGNNFYGYLAQVRVSTVARSSDWVTTSYNNQSAPGSFLTLGSEVAPVVGVSRILYALRRTTDAPTIADLSGKTGTQLRTTTDAPSISESLAKIYSILRTTTDSLTIGQTVSRLLAANRTVADAISTADAVARLETLLRAASELLSTSESALATKFGVVARTTAESLTTAEAATRLVAALRSCSDNLTLSESLIRVLSEVRTGTDSLSVAMTVVRLISIFRTTTDSITTAESLARAIAFLKTTADNPTIAESASRLLTALRTTTDHPFTSESATGLKIKLGSANDALSVAMTVARTLSALRATTDALNTSEFATDTATHSRSSTDALSIAESIIRLVGPIRTAGDALSIAQSVSTLFSRVRSTAENPTTSDLATRALTALRAAIDSLSASLVANQFITHQSLVRDSLEAATTSDLANRILNASRNGSDALLASVVGTANHFDLRFASDHPFTSELAIRAILQSRSSVDALLTSELISLLQILNRLSSDYLSTSEELHLPLQRFFTYENLSTSNLVLRLTGAILKIIVGTEVPIGIKISLLQLLQVINVDVSPDPVQEINIELPIEMEEIEIEVSNIH